MRRVHLLRGYSFIKEEPQKVDVKERFSLEFYKLLLWLPFPPLEDLHHPAHPRAPHHLSMGNSTISIERELSEVEPEKKRTIASLFPEQAKL